MRIPYRWVISFAVCAACSGGSTQTQVQDPAAKAADGETAAKAVAEEPLCNEEAVCTEQCDGGYAVGCERLGKGLLFGVWKTQRIKAAVAPMKKACDLGRGEACAVLAKLIDEERLTDLGDVPSLAFGACTAGSYRGCYFASKIADTDREESDLREKGERLARAECDEGNQSACMYFAAESERELMERIGYGGYEEGDFPPEEDEGYLELEERRRALSVAVTKACAGDDLVVCAEFVVGTNWEMNDNEELLVELRDAARALCEKGGATGCYQAAEVANAIGEHDDIEEYYERTCELDAERCDRIIADERLDGLEPERAAKFYERSCERGLARACGLLGDLYAEGRGVPKDLAKAMPLLEKGCGTDGGGICIQVANAYYKGEGVGKDLKKAATFFNKACGSWKRGCEPYAKMLFDGTLVPKDRSRAAVMVELACKRTDSPEACVTLGLLLENGEGLDKDADRAKAVYKTNCWEENRCGCEFYQRAKRKKKNKVTWVEDCKPLSARALERKIPLPKALDPKLDKLGKGIVKMSKKWAKIATDHKDDCDKMGTRLDKLFTKNAELIKKMNKLGPEVYRDKVFERRYAKAVQNEIQGAVQGMTKCMTNEKVMNAFKKLQP